MSKRIRADLAQQAARILEGTRRAAVPREDAAPDDVLAGSGFWRAWGVGSYGLHAVCQYQGQVWRCVQAHTAQVGWEPGPGSALWAAYHARELELARPWVQPYGSHDAYQPGEYMIWQDGRVYLCAKADTVWGPAETPDRWDVVGNEDAMEPGSGEDPNAGEPEEPTPDEPVEPQEPAYAPWVQPLGGHDAYAAGDRVTHKGKVWQSTVGGNVWEPGAYGWNEVINE